MRYSCTLYSLAAKLSETLYEIAINTKSKMKPNQTKRKTTSKNTLCKKGNIRDSSKGYVNFFISQEIKKSLEF